MITKADLEAAKDFVFNAERGTRNAEHLTKTAHTTDAGSGDHSRDDAAVIDTSTPAPSPAGVTTSRSAGVAPAPQATGTVALRSGGIFVHVCMTCWAVKDGATWRPLTEAEQDRIWLDDKIKLTTGCCPECTGAFRRSAKQLHAAQHGT